jgi:anti-anti-sigma factor
MAPKLTVLEPTGVLSGLPANELRAAAHAILREGTDVLLIDLSGVSFTDSSGLGCFISILKQSRLSGIDFFICSPNGQARELFHLTGMETIIPIFEDRAAFDRVILTTQR